MKIKDKPLTKLLKARSMLILDHPFFGCLALKLQLIEEPETTKSATTDGTSLYYNPDYIDSLPIMQTKGLLAHEVMHCALGHTWRQGDRESRRWNMAVDYTVNENLLETGFTLPKGYLRDSQYDNLSAEEIYALLSKDEQKKDKQNKQQQKKSGGSGKNKKQQQQKKDESKDKEQPNPDPGRCGGVTPPKDKNEMNQTQMEWKAAVSQAIQITRGELSGDLYRQLQVILDPPLPWYILLRDFVERSARNDYNWMVPSRRYFSTGIILPSLISEELPEVAIAIDTSGSISKEQLSRFAHEISNILAVYETRIRIFYCDSQVKKEVEINRNDLPLELKPVGGGGTDFRPVFQHINKKGYTPSCLIYFTDLYGHFPKTQPEYPTMWITTNKDDERAPFGITVNFN